MKSTLQFRTARKEKLKARIALIGVTGGGKTKSALLIMRGLVGPTGRFAVIDTERESAKLYADESSFDHLALTNHHPQQYIDALQVAADAGYDGVIIDSLSHAWMGKDGALELVDKAAKKSQSGNNFTAWRDITPLHNKLVDALLAFPGHLIATVRSKMEYVIEQDKGGKTSIRKVGLAPVQRDGLEYEFTLVGDMTPENNELIVTKTRWSEVRGMIIEKPDETLGRRMADWLNDGAEGEPRPTPAVPTPASTNSANGSYAVKPGRLTVIDWGPPAAQGRSFSQMSGREVAYFDNNRGKVPAEWVDALEDELVLRMKPKASEPEPERAEMADVQTQDAEIVAAGVAEE